LIETDGYGRYHLPDVDGGRRAMGKNMILKVDKSSLPKGARFTTENPRVLRITSSALGKINFGIKLPVQQQAPKAHGTYKAPKKAGGVKATQENIVEVSLNDDFFVTNQATVLAKYQTVIDDIAAKIRQHGQGQVVIKTGTGANAKRLATLRANAVRKLLHRQLADMMGHVQVITQ